MKKVLWFLILTMHWLAWSPAAVAAPCGIASVQEYGLLGHAGCTIGSFTFSDFALLPPAGGAVAFDSIVVTPVVVGSTIIGLDFTLDPTSSSGLYHDSLISYRVSGLAAALNGATVDFTGSGTTGDAAVSVNEDLCLDGIFLGSDGVSGCTTGNVLDLAVLNIFDTADPAYSLPFDAVGSLAVVTDIASDSGPFGEDSSTLTSAVNRFGVTAAVVPMPVPEPDTGLLLGGGALGLALLQRRSRRR